MGNTPVPYKESAAYAAIMDARAQKERNEQGNVRAVRAAQPLAMKRERPVIISATWRPTADNDTGLSVLVVGGAVETLAVKMILDSVDRKIDCAFSLIQPDGRVFSKNFRTGVSQFAVRVDQVVTDGTYMQLQVIPAPLNEKEEIPLYPALVSFGASLRVRKELVLLEELYEYPGDTP